MKQRPWRIKLVHGEKKAQQSLAEVLEDRGFRVV
jgi:predicted metal-dependent RNase